jgi:predicted nucleic acid-binding protein
MAVYFLDSSALLKRYRDEAGSQRVSQLIETGERLVIARLAHVEVSAAIVRREISHD